MENLKFVRLYFAETRGASFSIRAGQDEELKEKHEEIIGKLSDVFKRGIRKQLFIDFDPYLLATGLEGMTHAFLVQHLDHSDEHPFEADSIIRLFFETIMKGAK